MARPTKKNPLGKQKKPKRDNPETIRKLEEAFALDCTVWEACYYANISQDTYYDLVRDRPELLEIFTRLRERPVLIARQTVVNNLKENPELSLKYLERKRKAEFSTRTENTWSEWWPIQQIISYSIPDNERWW